MDTLPEELLVLICGYCEHASQKSLRLVQKRWCAVSSPSVFEHFYMGLFEYGLDKLRSISQSPTLAQHIKKFTIYSDILPSWTALELIDAVDYRPPFSSWYASVAFAPSRSEGQSYTRFIAPADAGRRDFSADYEALPRHDFGQAELDGAKIAFMALSAEQRSWRQELHGMRMKEALSSLPNLGEANVTSTTPFAGKTNDWAVWKALRRVVKVGPDDWRYSTDHFDAEYAQQSGYAALALTEAVGYRATFHGLKPITTLLIHSSHWASFEDLTRPQPHAFGAVPHLSRLQYTTASPFAVSSTRHQIRVDAFRKLVVLKLHISHATPSSRVYGPSLQYETIHFLQAATLLKDLDLRFTDDELSPDEELPHLESLFAQEALWPNIERLSLATNLSAEVLLGFLARHSATIRVLELRDMLITDVQRALQEIPRVVNLEHIHAECLWDYSPEEYFLSVLSQGTDHPEPYERDMKAYLLGKSARMPALAWDGARGSEVGLHDEDDLLILPLGSDDEISHDADN